MPTTDGKTVVTDDERQSLMTNDDVSVGFFYFSKPHFSRNNTSGGSDRKRKETAVP